jgi:uncharacterized protein YjbJ (UPF0337 family)
LAEKAAVITLSARISERTNGAGGGAARPCMCRKANRLRDNTMPLIIVILVFTLVLTGWLPTHAKPSFTPQPRDYSPELQAGQRSKAPGSFEVAIDWDRIQGNWKQFKGKIRENWGLLTDNDLDKIAGRREQLEGIIQERYGISKDEARKQLDEWLNKQQFQ